MQKIKRTRNMRNKFAKKAKVLFGSPVVIGRQYAGACFLSDVPEIKHDLKAVHANSNIIVVGTLDEKDFFFLSGDISAYGGKVYAENQCASIHFDNPLSEIVSGAAAPEEQFSILHNRYTRIPAQLLRLVVGA